MCYPFIKNEFFFNEKKTSRNQGKNRKNLFGSIIYLEKLIRLHQLKISVKIIKKDGTYT